MAARKASGANIEDWQRGTERLTLRLKPEVMDRLYSLSTELSNAPGTPVSYARVVTEALAALERELENECAANEHVPDDVKEPHCANCGRWLG